jgi:hypothetical protein
MILYKYYGYDSGLKALESQNLGFRKPVNFNDPFELSFLSNGEGPQSKQFELIEKLKTLQNTVVILSLTRTPDNPLMWAHYAQEHTGFVIGYNVTDKFFKSSEYNVIPVTAGDVVYTNTKNSHVLDPEAMDRIHQVYLSCMGAPDIVPDPEAISFFRKIFLTKHASWVYEEEVRVVKMLDSFFEESAIYQSDERRSYYSLTKKLSSGMDMETVPGLFIYNHKAPIKEVYLGVRNRLDIGEIERLNALTCANFYKFEMETKSWNLKKNKIKL